MVLVRTGEQLCISDIVKVVAEIDNKITDYERALKETRKGHSDTWEEDVKKDQRPTVKLIYESLLTLRSQREDYVAKRVLNIEMSGKVSALLERQVTIDTINSAINALKSDPGCNLVSIQILSELREFLKHMFYSQEVK